MRGRTFFFFLVLGMALDSRAFASGRVALRWSAPGDCPTEETVLAEVDRLLGARAASDETVLDVVAEVRRKDNGAYVVRLEIPGADGPRVREVSAVSCVALGQATALILAMMIDPEAALTAPPSPASRAAESPVEPPSSKPVEPGKTPAELPAPALPPKLPTIDKPSVPPVPPVSKGAPKKITKNRRPRLSGSLYLVTDMGSLPKPTFGASAAFGILPGSWKLELGATYLIEKSGTFVTNPSAGANVNLFAGHVAGGRVISLHSKVDIIPRIRFDVARFQATSFGVSDVAQGSSFSAGLGLGGIMSVRISKYLRTGLALDGIALITRPRFIVTGLGVAHEPSTFVWRLALGTEVQF